MSLRACSRVLGDAIASDEEKMLAVKKKKKVKYKATETLAINQLLLFRMVTSPSRASSSNSSIWAHIYSWRYKHALIYSMIYHIDWEGAVGDYKCGQLISEWTLSLPMFIGAT